MEHQFAGMSEMPFTYEEFESTRDKLVRDVNSAMTEDDKKFLIGFEELTIDWNDTIYSDFRDYPSVKWKIHNLQKLKASNPKKLKAEADKLREVLDI